MAKQYSLTVQNKSGALQTVAIYQYNSRNVAFSLVWLSQEINDQQHYTFSWESQWGLGWGTTEQTIDSGVIYRSGQDFNVEPNQLEGNNKIDITYKNSNFFSDDSYYYSKLKSGIMQINTDKSFTVAQSAKMSVGLYMDGKPVLVEQGAPNSFYRYYGNTNYCLTVTNYPLGTALPLVSSSNFLHLNVLISQPNKVEFGHGTEATYCLNKLLEFERIDSLQ